MSTGDRAGTTVDPTTEGAGGSTEVVTTLRRVRKFSKDEIPLAEALDGNQDAWNHIVDQHTRLLWWVARSYRLDESTAADVVQTVWFQLGHSGKRIEDPRRLPAWLATTTRREALRRTTQREVPTEDLGSTEPDRTVPDHDEAIIDEELTGLVMAAFAQLPAKDQELLRLLTEVPPKSYDEIAEILGKSHGYIGPSRQRALARLRQLLNDLGGVV